MITEKFVGASLNIYKKIIIIKIKSTTKTIKFLEGKKQIIIIGS